MKKGIYIDGHECSDVVEAQKNFLEKCHIMNGKYFALMSFIYLTYHVYQA